MKRVLVAALMLLALAPEGAAQNAITQEGTALQNSPMMFRSNNRARQGATVNGAPTGQTVTTGDSVVGGRCDYSAPTDAPDGWYRMCIDAKTGTLRIDGTKIPTLPTLKLEINGQVYDVPASATIIGSDAAVSNNDALKIAIGGAGQRLVRLGFYQPGDGGAASYNWSPTNCTLADNGSQVQPTSTTGCWIADFSTTGIRPQQFGAKTDDAIDDAPALQAAITAAGGQRVHLPKGKYLLCSTITSDKPIWLQGDGSGSGPGFRENTTSSILSICSANMDGFLLTSQYGSKLERFWLTSEVKQSTNYAGIRVDGGPGAYMATYSFDDIGLGSQAYNGAQTLWDAIKIVQPNYPDFNRIYCQGWQGACISMANHANFEGSGGFIHHSYFFGNPNISTQGPAIYSETAYTFIHHNEILAGSEGIHICINNYPAGEIDISHNTIENSLKRGIFVNSCDGSVLNMIQITNNEFSNNSYTANMGGGGYIVFGEYADGRNWLNNVLVKDNFFSGNMPADGKYIWMQNGGNTIISDNIINHQTAGTNPVAIQISGQTSNTGYSYPTIVKHNVIRGTTNRYDGNSTLAAIFIDAVPILLSKLPLATAGSVMWAADGTPGTDPCTGGGTGTQAFPNGDFTWRCKP